MQNEEIGTVVSTPEGPSPSNLEFVVNSGTIHRGQFVELDYSEGKLIAMVNDVIKTNRYFERADSVKEFEASGRKLFEQFPTGEWEYLVAKAKPLGVYLDGNLKRPSYPPSPGTKVKVAENETLKKFLAFDESGMHLGQMEFHDLPVKLNMSRLLRKHLAILAISGAGKSVAAKSMIEELLDRTKEAGRMAVVVFDVHGEYTSFAEPQPSGKFKNYSHKTRLIRAADIRIGVPKLSVGLISTIIPGLSVPQKRDLTKIINKMRSDMRTGSGAFDLEDIKNEIQKSKDKTAEGLIGWVENLQELGIFGKIDVPSLSDVVQPGMLTIIDLSELIDMRKKQIIAAYFANKMFHERRDKKIPPFLLVFEEAHQFAPEATRREEAISRGIIKTIAREGRKFGASLCLISQRPVQLDTTVLSQCNTHLILRVTNPYDIDHIAQSSEGLDKKSIEMINSLRVGEALIVGEAVNYPLFFRVRKNQSAESKHEKSLEDAAKDFEENRKQIAEEIKQLL